MKLTIFGTGYVGLVTGACLAEVGHTVVCMDVDQTKIDALRAGRIPIWEPGLEPIVARNVAEGRLRFTTDTREAVDHAEVQFIAVGTPADEDGSADLQYVLAVADGIARHMSRYRVIVNKSTVPVGTAHTVRTRVEQILAERGQSIPFDVVSNPEFLKEGAAVGDFLKPDRIIIGTDSAKAQARMRELYEPFNRNHERTMFMDVRSAELTKYAANAMLATKISFMNELANLSERLGADIEEVRKGIGADPRIGYHFIYPGCGYGGSCFPKDVQALSRTADQLGYDAPLLKAVEAVNQRQKTALFSKLATHFGGPEALRGRSIAVWGLSFNAQHRRHARSPEPHAARSPLAGRRASPGLRSGGDGRNPTHLRRPPRSRASQQQVQRAGRRGCARDLHRMAAVPRAGLRRDAEPAGEQGHRGRAEPVQPGASA